MGTMTCFCIYKRNFDTVTFSSIADTVNGRSMGELGVEEPEEASELAEAELLAFWLEELEEPPATPIKISSTTITIMAIRQPFGVCFLRQWGQTFAS